MDSIQRAKLQILADDERMQEAIQTLFKFELSNRLHEVSASRSQCSNEHLGAQSRALWEAQELVKKIFIELKNYKSVEPKKDITNPAR